MLFSYGRSLNYCYEWTHTHKNKINRDVIFGKIYLTTHMFLYSNLMKFALQFPHYAWKSKSWKTFSDDRPLSYVTKLSRIWARFQKYLLEFDMVLTKNSIAQCQLMQFHFKTEFFFHYKNTKCTLNFGLKSLEKLRSLYCSSQLPATKKTMMNFPGANLLLGPFTFLQNESWVFSSTSTLYLYISSVHFKAHGRGDLRNLRLNFTARRWLFLACTNRQMADG